MKYQETTQTHESQSADSKSPPTSDRIEATVLDISKILTELGCEFQIKSPVGVVLKNNLPKKRKRKPSFRWDDYDFGVVLALAPGDAISISYSADFEYRQIQSLHTKLSTLCKGVFNAKFKLERDPSGLCFHIERFS